MPLFVAERGTNWDLLLLLQFVLGSFRPVSLGYTIPYSLLNENLPFIAPLLAPTITKTSGEKSVGYI